ncbi:hypothetical protein [Robinsoniella peoriensis]
MTIKEFKNEVELDTKNETELTVVEIFQADYLEIRGIVYCLTSYGIPLK